MFESVIKVRKLTELYMVCATSPMSEGPPEEGKVPGNLRTLLAGLDTSGVQVANHNELSAIEMGSPEEALLMLQLEALLAEQTGSDDQKVMARWETFKAASVYKWYPCKELPLWCLRARSHTVEGAAELLPRVMSMMEELEIGVGDQKQLHADLQSKAIIDTGTKDAHGRAIIWMRLRYIDSTRSSASDIARLFTTVLLHALRDTGVQRHGFVWLADCSRSSFMNITPATVNAFWRTVLPNVPICLGRVFIVNPPWFISQIMWPIVSSFLPLALRKSHVLIYGARKELWAERLAHFDVPDSSIPTELGGLADVDSEAYATSVIHSLHISTEE